MMRMGWLSLFLMIFPVVCVAADSSLNFTPPPSDYSVIFLGNLFGMVDGVLHGTGSQIMGAMFAVFNAAVVALGGIVIVYTTIVGTMNTAHEGQLLGQKWSSIWITVRTTIGIALLIPKASGYCLMQIFIMWVTVQGVGAGDKIWNAALEYLNRGGVIVKAQNNANSTTGSENHNSTYNNALITLSKGSGGILQGLVCMKGLQTLLENQRATLLKNAEKGTGICSKDSLAATNVDPLIVNFCGNAVPNFISTVNAFDTLMGNYTSSCDTKDSGSDTTPSTSVSKSSMTYSVDMPNFDGTSPYSALTGVCGQLFWSDFNMDMSGMPSLSCTDQDVTRQSRAIAVQQVYSDLTAVASAMVDNDPQINIQSASSSPQYNSVARGQFGIPYSTSGSGTTVCSNPSPDCANWGIDKLGKNPTLILTGFELQNALADYNNIMAPALNLKSQQYSPNGNAEKAFIKGSEEQGWIMAGAYFFDLAYLNGLVTANSDVIDIDSGLSVIFSPSDLPKNASLLTLFGGSATPLSNLETLIDANGIDNNGPYDFDVSTITKAMTDTRSSTVNGYVTNAALLHLPGQPGLDSPKFDFEPNIQPGQSLSAFPKKNFKNDFGKFKDFFYNTMFRGIMNTLVNFLSSIYTMIMQTLLQIPLSALMDVFNDGIQLLQTTMIHPIVALAYMGAAFINASVDVWLNLILSCIALTIPTLFLVWPFTLMALPFLSSWLGIMTSIGFIDAYYVPFVPYMIFTFGAIAWLMAVIESMVAGPLVALGIMHPEGHDALGKAEQSIMILVNIFLRPSLMIIGYIGAIALSYVSVFILNSGFGHLMQFLLPGQGDQTSAWFNMAQNGTTDNLLNTVGTPYYSWSSMYAAFFCLVTYTSMYVTVVQKTFTLIYILPDKILRWLGSQGESIGQETAQWAEETKGQTKDTGEATGKSSMKTGGGVMRMFESAAVGANKGVSGGSASST